jgi:hypothetical protein
MDLSARDAVAAVHRSLKEEPPTPRTGAAALEGALAGAPTPPASPSNGPGPPGAVKRP